MLVISFRDSDACFDVVLGKLIEGSNDSCNFFWHSIGLDVDCGKVAQNSIKACSGIIVKSNKGTSGDQRNFSLGYIN